MSLQKASTDEAKVARVQSLLEEYANGLDSCGVKIGKVVDKPSAISASEELKKSAKRFREIAKDLKSEGKLTKAEEARLAIEPLATASENFSKASKGFTARMQQGTLRLEATEDLPEALLDFSKTNMEVSNALRAMSP